MSKSHTRKQRSVGWHDVRRNRRRALLRLWIVRVCKLASFRGRCLKTCQGNVKRGEFSLQNVTSTIQDHIAMFERGHQESVLPSPIDMGPIEDLAVTIIRGWSR